MAGVCICEIVCVNVCATRKRDFGGKAIYICQLILQFLLRLFVNRNNGYHDLLLSEFYTPLIKLGEQHKALKNVSDNYLKDVSFKNEFVFRARVTVLSLPVHI